MSRRRESAFAFLGLAVLATAIALLAGCGDDRDGDREPAGRTTSANHMDRQFLREMKPHHRSAIEMAELARSRADHPQLASLATAIIAAQSTEIQEIDRLQRRIGATGSAGGGMHGSMSARELARLRSAKPFDKTFIELMIPHHQDAVEMSRAALEMGGDADTKALAQKIMFAQRAEIQRMRAWYRSWYRQPVPTAAPPRRGGPDHGTRHP